MPTEVKPQTDPSRSLTVVADATCTCCGCVCDDIDLTVKDNRIVEARRACHLGEAWFASHSADEGPSCLIAGRPASIDEGVERAAQILTSAKYPLIYGLGHTTCEAQRVAVGIADWIGATVDTETSTSHGPLGTAFQGVGEVTCSLGEVANRADLVIFWGTNPAETQPRHLARYSLLPQGMFVPGGRGDRTCVVVDVEKTASAGEADFFLQIKPGHDFEALWILRALAGGIALDRRRVETTTSVPLAAWQDLMVRMKRARFGVIMFGSGLMMTRGRHLNGEAVLALVRDMNAFTRFVSRPMRGGGNGTGADNVLAWRTGYPFGVNLSRGYPRFNPGEFTAEQMLARGETDAVMIVACDPTESLSAAACARLAKIDTITIGPHESTASQTASVAFHTAMYGIHTAGTVYRPDDVPIPLRPALESSHPSEFEILSRIERRVIQLIAERHP